MASSDADGSITGAEPTPSAAVVTVETPAEPAAADVAPAPVVDSTPSQAAVEAPAPVAASASDNAPATELVSIAPAPVAAAPAAVEPTPAPAPAVAAVEAVAPAPTPVAAAPVTVTPIVVAPVAAVAAAPVAATPVAAEAAAAPAVSVVIPVSPRAAPAPSVSPFSPKASTSPTAAGVPPATPTSGMSVTANTIHSSEYKFQITVNYMAADAIQQSSTGTISFVIGFPSGVLKGHIVYAGTPAALAGTKEGASRLIGRINFPKPGDVHCTEVTPDTKRRYFVLKGLAEPKMMPDFFDSEFMALSSDRRQAKMYSKDSCDDGSECGMCSFAAIPSIAMAPAAGAGAVGDHKDEPANGDGGDGGDGDGPEGHLSPDATDETRAAARSIAARVAPGQLRDWHISMWTCCNDYSELLTPAHQTPPPYRTAAIVCFDNITVWSIPCFPHASLTLEIMECWQGRFCNPLAVVGCCFFSCVFWPVCSTARRYLVRDLFSIQGNCPTDCVTSTFCPCPALIQESFELARRKKGIADAQSKGIMSRE